MPVLTFGILAVEQLQQSSQKYFQLLLDGHPGALQPSVGSYSLFGMGPFLSSGAQGILFPWDCKGMDSLYMERCTKGNRLDGLDYMGRDGLDYGMG